MDERELRAACAELDRRLRAGEDVRAEQVLAERPALSTDPESAVELVYAEFVARQELGQTPDPQTFLARFPQWRDALRRQLDVHASFGEPVARAPVVGDRLGEYELLERVATGGVGIVYKARHVRLGHPAAVKVLLAGAHAAEEDLERFRNEARALARLSHPNVVRLFEMGRPGDGPPFLALEWVDGGSLADRRSDSLPAPAVAARLVAAVARAVADCHAQGVLHGDLKPANILLAAGDVPKLADFGFARMLGAEGEARRSATLRATPCYAAPEQLDATAPLGPAADVYGLGGILYELLTGRPPFLAGTPAETLRMAVAEEPVPPRRLQPRVPRDLETICLRCLEKSPARRYPGAAAAAEDLERFGRGEPILARPVSIPERAWRWACRRPAAAALAALAVVAPPALAGAGAAYVVNLRAAREEADRQRGRAEARVEDLRRTAYALQVAQAGALWDRDPGRARALLHDPERCPEDLREFTWRLLDALSNPESEVWADHGASCWGLAWSPDGRRIASTGERASLLLRRPDTGEVLRRVDLTDRIFTAVAFSPDSRVLAASTGRGSAEIRLFAAEDGRELGLLTGTEAAADGLAWSPDGRTLAAGHEDGRVRLWDVESRAVRAELDGYRGGSKSAAWSPDGRRLAAAVSDRAYQFWDAATGAVLGKVEGRHLGAVRFSPDGRRVAFPNGRSAFEIRDAATLELQRSVLTPHARLSAVEFSPDGRTVATGGGDHAVRLWGVEDGREQAVLRGATRLVARLAFSPDGERIAASAHDGAVRVWERRRSNPAVHLLSVPQPVAVVVARDGRGAAVAGGNLVRMLDVETGADHGRAPRAHGEGGATSGLLTPDGRGFLTAGAEGTLKAWLFDGGPKSAVAFPGVVRILAVRESGGRLEAVVLDPQGRCAMLDLRTGERRAGPAVEDARAAVFTPDGRRLLIAAGADLSVLRADGWSEERRLPQGGGTALALSPDGRTLAVCREEDATVTLWALPEWTRRATLSGPEHGPAAAFSPDGRTLVTAGRHRWDRKLGEAKLWDAASGRELTTLPDTAAPVCFLPDGSGLATLNDDGDVLRWSALRPSRRADGRRAAASEGGSGGPEARPR